MMRVFWLVLCGVGFVSLGRAGIAQAQLVPPGVAPGEQYHLVLVTSIAVGVDSDTSVPPTPPLFGGVPAADWTVTNAAFNGGHLGVWNGVDSVYRAVLSAAGEGDAIDHVSIQAPVYNLNGELVATGESEFFSGALQSRINVDEFGNLVVGEVWTGSFPFGNPTGNDCGNWTDPLSGAGTIGSTEFQDFRALSNSLRICSETAHLYGISPLLTAPDNGPAGDLDDDNDVDGADVLAWQRESGDADLLADLLENYGTVASSASVSQVPEPTSLLLCVLALLLAATGGRTSLTVIGRWPGRDRLC